MEIELPVPDGLTLEKLRAARKRLGQMELDPIDQPITFCGADEAFLREFFGVGRIWFGEIRFRIWKWRVRRAFLRWVRQQ